MNLNESGWKKQRGRVKLSIIQNILFLVVAFLIAGDCICAAEENVEKNVTLEDIRKVLKDNPELIGQALLDNSDILFDMLSRDKIRLFELAANGGELKRKRDEWKRLTKEYKNPFVPVIDENRIFAGTPDGPIKMVVYSDFQCVNCVKMAKSLEAVLEKKSGLITLYFKHYVRANNLSRQLAIYFEAIGKQSAERAWKFHDLVFQNREKIKRNPKQWLQLILLELSLDQQQLKLDLKNKSIHDRIDSDTKEAQQFGFKGTPMVLINGVSLAGAQSQEAIEQIIEFVRSEGDINSLKLTAEERELCVECP